MFLPLVYHYRCMFFWGNAYRLFSCYAPYFRGNILSARFPIFTQIQLPHHCHALLTHQSVPLFWFLFLPWAMWWQRSKSGVLLRSQSGQWLRCVDFCVGCVDPFFGRIMFSRTGQGAISRGVKVGQATKGEGQRLPECVLVQKGEPQQTVKQARGHFQGGPVPDF